MPVSFKTLFLISLLLTVMVGAGPTAAGALFLVCWVVFFLINNVWLNLILGLILFFTIALPAAVLAGVVYVIMYSLYTKQLNTRTSPTVFDNRGRPVEDAVFTEVA